MNFFRFFLCLFFIYNYAFSEEFQKQDLPSLVFVPFLSTIAPGLGQALDGQQKKSWYFLGFGAAGVTIFESSRNEIDRYWAHHDYRSNREQDLQDFRSIGASMYTHAGLLSSYDTFLFRVKKYQEIGQYKFIPPEQNLETVLKSPFQFSFLTRPTTWIPFLAAIGVGISEFQSSPRPTRFEMRAQDVTASCYVSYNAGTGEEAYFRGWLLPVLYQNSDNFILSNSAQALAFGFMHGPRPYFQTAFGLYTGWLTRKNNFDLSESIFIHAWWDFWVLAAEYARDRNHAHSFQIPLIEFNY